MATKPSHPGSGTAPSVIRQWRQDGAEQVARALENHDAAINSAFKEIRAISTTSTTAATTSTSRVTSVTASEVGTPYLASDGFLYMQVAVSASVTATAFSVPVRLWFDFDDGNGYTVVGVLGASSALSVWVIGSQEQKTGVTSPGKIKVPVDPARVNWKVAAESDSVADQPSAAAALNTFVVTAAQPVTATDITNIQFVLNPLTADAITYQGGDIGSYKWEFYELDFTLPAKSAAVAGGDPYFKGSFVTRQLGYSATGSGTVTGGVNLQKTAGAAFAASDVGNMIHVGTVLMRVATYTDATHVILGPVLAGGTAAVPNGAGQSFEIWRPAPADAVNGDEGIDDPGAIAQGYWGHRFLDGPPPSTLGQSTAQFKGTPTHAIPPNKRPDAATNLYRTTRYWTWGVSVLADNEAGGTNTITLQQGWPGAADHGDLTPAMQTPSVDLTQIRPDTIAGPLYQDISNNLSLKISSDYVVSGGALTQNIINLALATNFGIEFIKSGGLFIVNAIAVNKLIAGDALFAGQATFATNGGGKLTINSSGITIADNNFSPNATVTIASTGATIAKGSNNVQVTASGVAINGPSGSLTALSGGVSITNGSNSVQVTSAHVQISNGSSSVTVTAASVAIANGAFSVTSGTVTVNIDATNFIKVTDSANSTTQISGTGVHVVNAGAGFDVLVSSSSVAVTASGVTSTLFSNSLWVNGFQVVGGRQAGPGIPLGFADATAQAWALALYNALKPGGHGLVT